MAAHWARAAAVCGLLGLCAAAHAHLMVAQKGTLNFSGGGAYLLLSVPVSAFMAVDDDGDRLLSAGELQAHAKRIEQQFRSAVQLRCEGRVQELQGLLLNLSPPDDAPGAPASQLVVMGRFALHGATVPADKPDCRFSLALFGHAPGEQAYDISFTHREAAARLAPRAAHDARYTPAQTEHRLFSTAGERLVAWLGTLAARLRP